MCHLCCINLCSWSGQTRYYRPDKSLGSRVAGSGWGWAVNRLMTSLHTYLNQRTKDAFMPVVESSIGVELVGSPTSIVGWQWTGCRQLFHLTPVMPSFRPRQHYCWLERGMRLKQLLVTRGRVLPFFVVCYDDCFVVVFFSMACVQLFISSLTQLNGYLAKECYCLLHDVSMCRRYLNFFSSGWFINLSLLSFFSVSPT